jgi:DNA-binding NarL/FixJ family response regulator
MVNGISNNAAASYDGANTQTDPVQRTQATTAGQSITKTAAPGEDTVKLSPTAQARLMLHQGISVKQIARNLGLSVQAVSTSLGLTTTSSVAPATAPPPTSPKK